MEDTGRLTKTLYPEVLRLLENEPSLLSKDEELRLQVSIDEAHLLMLHKKGLLNKDKVCAILREIDSLKTHNFYPLQNKTSPRGNYLLYEDYLIQKLGIEIAGVLHTARSRNDINATLFKLKAKLVFFETYDVILKLRKQLIECADESQNVVLPIYSQYQVALPSTLAHYWLALESSLRRDQAAFESLHTDLNVCPMGSAAGGGTSFTIDSMYTARLLGFNDYARNSLDAIANRDLALRLLANLSITAMTLSRLCEDLQLWSTKEFGFIELPDELCGGSSMMPQKKNPYLLEKLKGRLIALQGNYFTALNTMNKVPFGNSIEVGTEAMKSFANSFADFEKITKLLIIIIDNVKINEQKVIDNLTAHGAFTTYVCEDLVKLGKFNIRQAHHQLGQNVKNALLNNREILDEINSFTNNARYTKDDMLSIAHASEFGGGPGKETSKSQCENAMLSLELNKQWLEKTMTSFARANSIRSDAVQQLIKNINPC